MASWTWWREPLVQFLLIGAALFLLHHMLTGGESTAPREIIVTDARIQSLSETFARSWLRPPTAEELHGLIEDYVTEEIYYREAVAMGLDRDDSVIRRRLRQKMEFISEDVISSVPPTDAQLQAFLDQNAQKFLAPPRITFQEIFFSPERRSKAARPDAERLLADLRAVRGPVMLQNLGDPTLLPRAMEAATPQQITDTFGREFAAGVEEAPVGPWFGPVLSAYGLHLVRLERREAGATPALAQIRPLVAREWEAAQRRSVNDALLARLKARYQVRIEGPALHRVRQGSLAQLATRGE